MIWIPNLDACTQERGICRCQQPEGLNIYPPVEAKYLVINNLLTSFLHPAGRK